MITNLAFMFIMQMAESIFQRRIEELRWMYCAGRKTVCRSE